MMQPPAVAPLGVEVVRNMPAILAAFAAVIAAIGSILAAVLAARNGRKADEAVVRTAAVHEATQVIRQRADDIAEHTDGHLSVLLQRNQELHDMLTQAMAILSAREGKTRPIRAADWKPGGDGDARKERRQVPDRRKSDEEQTE